MADPVLWKLSLGGHNDITKGTCHMVPRVPQRSQGWFVWDGCYLTGNKHWVLEV